MSITILGKASKSTKQIFISRNVYDLQKVEDIPGSGIFYQKSNMNTLPGKRIGLG
jgi:hypothetical protein